MAESTVPEVAQEVAEVAWDQVTELVDAEAGAVPPSMDWGSVDEAIEAIEERERRRQASDETSRANFQREVEALKSDDQYAAVDPVPPSYMFKVTLGGDEIGEFMGVSGFERSIEPFSFQEGGRNHSPHVLIGPGSYGQISLRWGQLSREVLLRWMGQVRISRGFRRNINIFHLNRDCTPLRVYTLKGAWPVKWQGPDLDSGGSQVGVESLTLAYERLFTRTLSDRGEAS